MVISIDSRVITVMLILQKIMSYKKNAHKNSPYTTLGLKTDKK